MSRAASLKNKHLRFTLKSETGWTSYRVKLFDEHRQIGEGELKRGKITLMIEDKKYLGRIPGLLRQMVELIDEETNSIIYRSKPKFLTYPMIILDREEKEIFRINRDFWKSRYGLVHENSEIASMRKKGFLERTYELEIVKSPLDNPRELIALFMILLLMHRAFATAAAAATS